MTRLLLTTCIMSMTMFVMAQPMAEKGKLDLSGESFAKRPITLNGEWEFYWQQLLAPEEIKSTNEYVDFPSLWNDYNADAKGPSGFGYATYRLKVVLPDSAREYVLHIEDVYSAFVLYVNGQLKYKNGEVGTSRETYIPEWKPDFLGLGTLSDSLEIVLQVANFDHSKGGVSEGLELGTPDVMYNEERGIISLDLLLTGSLFMGGLFFLGLFIFGHHDKAILFFALFCISYAYRIIGFGYYVLHILVDISWYVAIRLEYLTLFLSTYLFCLFLQNLYPSLTKGRIWKVLNVLCIVFAIAVLISPPIFFTRLVAPFFVILLVYLVLTVRVYYLAYAKKLVGSMYILLSSIVIFVVFSYNIFVYFNILEPMVLATFFGYVLFFFTQSLVLSFRFAYTLKNEKQRAEIASQTKSDFLSTISHEIRTPLNAVVGLSHLLLTENPRKDQEENLISLKYSAEHLTALINDILDYNKLESGSVEFEEMEVNLHEMGKRMLKVYTPKAEEKGLSINCHCDPKVKTSLLLDATRFAQIMNNLIDNAIKFTKEGGVTMRMIMVEEDYEGQTLRFEIEDTGVGIPDDKKELIFERFTQASSSTTREFGGTGLGLSIIKKLLELQGTKIQVDSTVGKGSKFYFIQKFPYGSLTNPGAKEEVVEDVSLVGKRVLLVEDNRINIVVASKFLTNWGISYELAKNGVEAVEMAAADDFDLILMDLQMPEMDGYEATRRIRLENKEVPIVALTASALFRVQQGITQAGMNDFVTKPFDPKELRRKIAKYIL